MESTEYPEHEKMRAIADQSRGIGEFLDWMSSSGTVLAYWDQDDEGDDCLVPDHKSIEQRLAEYFGIDLNKINAEKGEMFAKLSGSLT